MKKESKEKFAYFMKRRGYLVAIAVGCVALAITTAFVLSNSSVEDAERPRPTPSVSVAPSESPAPSLEPSVSVTLPPSAGPVATVIVFDSPVQNGRVGMAFSEDELCFSQTLGYWYGHMGMDFIGEAGQDCLAVYDGVVESVTRDISSGTVVTVKINETLSVGYGSLAEEVSVQVGDTVKKGQKIGTISDSAYDEFKEGPHVHLTVSENGLKVNPAKYMQTEEK